MKVVLQRVSSASCTVNEEVTGQIGQGYLLLVCFEQGDNEKKLENMINKIVNLRIFEDSDGKMNLNLEQVKGEILSISQFTLSWDGKKGHRPSFDKSMNPQDAKVYYALFNRKLREMGFKVELGLFGEHMDIFLVNNGPVTFYLNY